MTSTACHRYTSTAGWNRRDWLKGTGMGLGSMALADLMSSQAQGAGGAAMPGLPHFAPKAKRVIFLFMSGGLSQLESFDPKPILNKRMGEEMPASLRQGKELLGMSKFQASFKLAGSPFKFQQHGQSGAWLSDLFPHTAHIETVVRLER